MPVHEVVAARSTDGDYERGVRPAARRLVRARAPYRLGLAGGGTDVSPFCDVYGGIVLNATIDRYCYTTIEQGADGVVAFASADLDTVEYLGDSAARLPLHAATYLRICNQFDLGRPAVTVTSLAEAPAGSGIGSSSTLVVSLVEAFREYFGLPLGEYEVARLAFEIERIDCCLSGGRQDQYAATFGGFNAMEFFAEERVIVNPLRVNPEIIREFEASLVLYYTGVSRGSAEIIAEQTTLVRDEQPAQISATLALKEEARSMKEALLLGDFHKVAEALRGGWEAKQQLAPGISTPAIEASFAAALDAGALAGKVSGAGGGGYILFVVEPLRRLKVVRALSELSGGSVEPTHFVPDGAVSWRLR